MKYLLISLVTLTFVSTAPCTPTPPNEVDKFIIDYTVSSLQEALGLIPDLPKQPHVRHSLNQGLSVLEQALGIQGDFNRFPESPQTNRLYDFNRAMVDLWGEEFNQVTRNMLILDRSAESMKIDEFNTAGRTLITFNLNLLFRYLGLQQREYAFRGEHTKLADIEKHLRNLKVFLKDIQSDPPPYSAPESDKDEYTDRLLRIMNNAIKLQTQLEIRELPSNN